MRISIVSTVLCIFLYACSPSDEAVQRAIFETQTSQPVPTATNMVSPTSTPTIIPLSDIVLDDLLFIEGDLPPNFLPGQITYEFPNYAPLSTIPEPVKITEISLQNLDTISQGIANVLLYDSLPELEEAYEKIITRLKNHSVMFGESREVSNVGEKAIVSEGEKNIVPGEKIKYLNFVSIRCDAIIFVMLLSPDATEEMIITYATRIDQRISEIICR